jgi:hypothetical protein
MKPGQQQVYDPEEIRKWKNLIYGQHWTNNKVDEWVSNGQDTHKTGRRKCKVTKSNNDSFSNSYSQDDWLHSPGTPKKNYRAKKF